MPPIRDSWTGETGTATILRDARSAWRPKSGASISWPASMIERRTARVRVKRSNSLSPSPQRIARCSEDEVLREPRQHFEDRVLVVQADVAPHGRVGGGKAGEVAKARGRIFDHLGLGDRLKVVGGADDVVGDDVRQMRDDGEHHVVVVGVHRVDVGAAAPPEFGQALERCGIGARQRREDAPAVLEQVGKAGVGAGFFRAGERMAGDEMHVCRHMRLHLRDHRALGRADIGDDGAGFQRRRDLVATAPDAPTGTETMTRSASLHRLRRIGRIAVAEAKLLGARQASFSLRVEMAMWPASFSRRMTRASDEPIRPMPTRAIFSNIGCGMVVQLFRNSASAATTPRLASSVPTVMRSALGKP